MIFNPQTMPSVSHLRKLINIISEHVDIIEDHALKAGVMHPTIDDIYDSENPNEKFTLETEVMQAALLAASAASQLAATLKLPGLQLYERSHEFHIPAALGIASDACAVELLREAGPDGMNVIDMAARTGTDGNLLGRALRLLATHYIFREVKPNVFANNRLSSMMDTGKSSDLLVALTKDRMNTPLDESGRAVRKVHGEKYKGTNGVAAFVDKGVEVNFKASAYMADMFINITGDSISAFDAAYRLPERDLWSFMESRPGHLERFQTYMAGGKNIHPPTSFTDDFDVLLSTIPEGGLVIDVGGGNGSLTYELAKIAPHLSYIVQDRPQTISDTSEPFWLADPNRKEMILSGKVKLQAQNFFEPQSEFSSAVSAFFLRFILHDWPNAECIKILTHLRRSASTDTWLVIIDQLMPYACPEDDTGVETHGYSIPPAPEPLLANLGEANLNVYSTDFNMNISVNGQERTMHEFERLMKESGWKIQKVYRSMGTAISRIVCKAV